MFLLRFKRLKEKELFLTKAEHACEWGLSTQLSDALKLETKEKVVGIINQIQAIVIPNNPLEWGPNILFLHRLYGTEWSDNVEGMMVQMHDVIKAQILDGQMNVIETHRLRNQTWDTHYV